MDVKAQIAVAGMFREGDPELDEDFVQNSIEGLFSSFVLPELGRREDLNHAIPERALIVLPPNSPPVVRLGAEAAFTAVAGAGADLVDPSEVFVGQITDVWPDAVDPDAGWSGWVTAEGGRVLVCGRFGSDGGVGVRPGRGPWRCQTSAMSMPSSRAVFLAR